MKRRLFESTVARADGRGRWWLMNRQRGGWSSFGYPYSSLEEIRHEWNVEIGASGRDEHSSFVEVIRL